MTERRHISGNRLRIAFAHIPGEGWSAGTYYLKNLFYALRSLSVEIQPEIVLLIRKNTAPEEYDELAPYVDEVLQQPSVARKAFFVELITNVGKRLGIVPEKGNPVSDLLKRQGVDVFFTLGAPPPNFLLPFLSWIPDFQHLHYPEFFSEQEITRRNVSFKCSARSATRVILSSNSSLKDFKEFAPWALDKARVLPFVAQVPAEVYDNSPESICSKYNLPERYIFLPNQFWKHKNHKVVVDALGKALLLCPHLTIVCTGNTNEERDMGYFGHLLGMISRADVREQMVLLGLVPRDDLFSLMRQSMAVLQPSLFEGWSTTVEEVKSLGKSLIVSDIPVHREQSAPGAQYFDPLDADSLADCLVRNFLNLRPGPDMKMEELAKASLRSRSCAFGRKFVEIVQEVM